MTERELIEGCKKGKRHCEREIFYRYAGRLLTVCRRYARHPMEAEDWLQDGFVRIFEKIGQFNYEGSFEGWMRRVVINVALRHLQKADFRNSPADLSDDLDVSVDPEVVSRLSEENLLQLINKLPDGYKLVFNLHAIEGFSHQEIAVMLQIEESTSRSQLTKARRLLQRWVGELERMPVDG